MAESLPGMQVSSKLNDWFGVNSTLSDSSWGSLGSGAASLVGTWSDYFAKERDAANRRAFQRYSNTMVDLSNSINQDSITLNEIQFAEASTQQAVQIQEQGMTATGSIEAAAGAAGVRGNSVSVGLVHTLGAAASAEYNREREFKYAMLGFSAQRTSSAMNAAMQKDYSQYSGGSLLSAGVNSLFSVGKMVGALL